MIIPEYWAEARRQYRGHKKQVTVRRFGWSNESQELAMAHAEQRADEALQLAINDRYFPRHERKVPYNGADGLPIREEAIDRQPTYVITRNSYGALCLNTPNVLFADIDVSSSDSLAVAIFLVSIALGVVIGLVAGLIIGLVAYVVAHAILAFLEFNLRRKTVSPSKLLEAGLARIEQQAASIPNWSIRVYQTPAGYRLLVTHQAFDPLEHQVEQFFRAFHVDPMYARMCRNQLCFRARLTAKPWRIGIPDHMRPRPGVWPVRPEAMAQRQTWIEHYQSIAVDYAACKFLKTLGPVEIHPTVAVVMQTHDQLTQATSGKPIA